MAPAGARPPTPPQDAAEPSPAAWRGLRIRRVSRGRVLAVVAVIVAFVLGLLIAPKGHGGLVLETDRGDNLWALVPTGWQDANLVAPYGSELDSWFDSNDPRESETVLARRPAGGTPRQLADQRAKTLGHITGYLQGYLGPVTFAGGRVAWVLQYSLGGTYTAVFEFDACAPATAVTVTIDAPTAGALSSEENALPEGAEPVCDGPAFTSPDRGDLAIPLHLPSP
jgi:hypothetical protein